MGSVELRGLTTHYGKVVGIEDVDLSVGDGEFFVILGPSGAGKTTTLKSVAGLVETTSGEVDIAGRRMTGVEPYHRNVAMAFESYALYPQKTVSQNLASPLRSGRTGKYGEAEQKKRIDAVTTTLGINPLLDRYPRELSNGQRQRVALGRVLVRPADVYLLDEPLSHLDAKLRAAMRAELKQLGEMSKTTTLYVTHDYQEELALGDRVAVLRHGRIVQIGTPSEVWLEPADTFVAKALGQPEINLLDAMVEDGRLRTQGGVIDVPVPRELGIGTGGRARLGIRPRDLHVGEEATGEDMVRIPGVVKLSERLGRSIEMTVDASGTQLIVIADSSHAAEEGSPVTVRVAPQHVHIFEAGEPDEETRRIGGLVPAVQSTPHTGSTASSGSTTQTSH